MLHHIDVDTMVLHGAGAEEDTDGFLVLVQTEV
jgi:hypothetical protein